jgi:CheY-like chemotaxis protein
MPKVDGLEVLRQVKSDEQLKSIPIVVLTADKGRPGA